MPRLTKAELARRAKLAKRRETYAAKKDKAQKTAKKAVKRGKVWSAPETVAQRKRIRDARKVSETTEIRMVGPKDGTVGRWFPKQRMLFRYRSLEGYQAAASKFDGAGTLIEKDGDEWQFPSKRRDAAKKATSANPIDEYRKGGAAWIRGDGKPAKNPTMLRWIPELDGMLADLNREAGGTGKAFYNRIRYLAELYGITVQEVFKRIERTKEDVFSSAFRDIASRFARKYQVPLKEVYTLWFSP